MLFFSNSSYKAPSSSGLIALVASSKIANRGAWKYSLANPILCFSPPERTGILSKILSVKNFFFLRKHHMPYVYCPFYLVLNCG